MARALAERHLVRFQELRHTVGLGRSLWIAPLWTVTKQYVVISRDLTALDDLSEPAAGFTCKGLDSTSPEELAAMDRRLDVAEVERRIEEGQKCEIWRRDDQIVHFRWVTPVPAYLPFLGLQFVPEDGDCLLYEVFTVADKRVRGVHTNVARHTLRRMSQAGYRRMIALCAWWNTPARKVGEKNGFKDAGTVTRWQTGPAATFSCGGAVKVQQKNLRVVRS